MDACTRLALEFVRNFSKTIRAFRYYSPEHKQAQDSIKETFGPLQKMLETQSPVLLGSREGVLILQSKPVRDTSPAVQAFCSMLAERSLSTFSVERGVTFDEFTHLVQILSKKPEELLEGNAVRPEHLKPLKNIRINEMKFVAVDDDVTEEDISAAVAGSGAVKDLSTLVASLMGGPLAAPQQPGAAGIPGFGAPMPPGGGVPVQPGAAGIPGSVAPMPPGGGVPVQPGAAGIPGTGAPMPPGGGVPVQPGAAGIPVAGAAIPAWMSEASQGGVPVQMGAASLQALGAAMTPLMNKAEQSEAVNVVSINFDRIIERVMANVPATKFVDEYLKGIDALPESVRRTISGGGDSKDAMIGRIPLGMRGRLLALDLSQGATDLMRLRQEMERIAPSPGEFVQLLEIVSRLVKESAESPEDAEKKLKSVLDLLPLSGEAKVERLSLLLMIPDRGELEAYAAALEQAGYAVTACRQPDFNIAALLQARVFDAMIIGVYPYQLTQLAFLKSPPEGTTFPPLFYVDDVTRIRSRKEMDFIPEGRFIYKPLSPDELVKVLTNDVPVTGEVVPPPDAGEVARAIQIQHELSPRELPVIPEYSIAARFEPGQAHGGNYHDVVSLPGRRFGILLMDVTGSRAAGTLALAAARANFRTISRQSGNAVETLVAMNNLLAGEIPRGTFVRAMYGVLDPKQGKLTVAGGGLPRPLRWNDDAPGIRALQVTGPPLGLTRGKVFEETLKTATVTLEPGDHVAFCTLAVTRSVNDQNKMLGERGVALAMQPSLKGPAGLALVEVVEAVRTHRGDEAPDADDFTVLELRREP